MDVSYVCFHSICAVVRLVVAFWCSGQVQQQQQSGSRCQEYEVCSHATAAQDASSARVESTNRVPFKRTMSQNEFFTILLDALTLLGDFAEPTGCDIDLIVKRKRGSG